MNDYKTALEICMKAFELFKPNVQMYSQRGAIYYHLKDYGKAIANYKKAIELEPEEDYWRVILEHIEQENSKD